MYIYIYICVLCSKGDRTVKEWKNKGTRVLSFLGICYDIVCSSKAVVVLVVVSLFLVLIIMQLVGTQCMH